MISSSNSNVSSLKLNIEFSVGSFKCKKTFIHLLTTQVTIGVFCQFYPESILSFFSWFQSYALLSLPVFTPITHDLSFHERLSVPVNLLLLVPLSNLKVLSYDFINAGSACIISELGFNCSHLANDVCVLYTSGNCCPFNLPVIASPVTCRHQLFVVASSSIALK